MIVIDTKLPPNCIVCPLYSSGLGVDFCTLASHGCVDRVNYNPSIKPQWCPIKCDIKDIKAEIEGLMSHDDYMVDGFNVLDIIDKHTKGEKELRCR